MELVVSPSTTARPVWPMGPHLYAEVTAKLERKGVDKFETSWGELLDGVTRELEKAIA
jgi:hypothetical protein